MGLERDHPPYITAAQSPVRRPMDRAGMEFDLEGEVGPPVRIQFTRQRVSRRGPDYRVPASSALRYVAELERAGVPPRNSPSMGLEAVPDATYWEWETTNFSPVIPPPTSPASCPRACASRRFPCSIRSTRAGLRGGPVVEKTKAHEWILVGLAAIAIADMLYVRHRSLNLAEALAAKGEVPALPGLTETEGDPGSLQGASLAASYLAGIPRN